MQRCRYLSIRAAHATTLKGPPPIARPLARPKRSDTAPIALGSAGLAHRVFESAASEVTWLCSSSPAIGLIAAKAHTVNTINRVECLAPTRLDSTHFNAT